MSTQKAEGPRGGGGGGGRLKSAVQPTPTELLVLASALEGSQQQCDEDGTMIAVSRQAVHESLKALRECATTLSAREDGWQVIETAPKDETWVLLFDADYENPYLYARWVHEGWWSVATSSGKSVVWRSATHWRPLPSPPKAPTAGEGRS